MSTMNTFYTPKKITKHVVTKVDDIPRGPNLKNVHTQTLEAITRLAIHHPSSVSFQTSEQTLWATIKGEKFNVGELLQKADLTHISFDLKDSIAYCHRVTTISTANPYLAYEHSSLYYDSATKYKTLTQGEKYAVLSYTQGSYDMNNLLYGSFTFLFKPEKTFLDVMFMAAAVNKMYGGKNSCTYRGDKYISEDDVHSIKQVIAQGGGYAKEPSFKSTSTSEHVAQMFSGSNKVIICVDNVDQCSLSSLSAFPSENEVVINPTHLYWHKVAYKGGYTYLHARVVKPVNDSENIYSVKQCTQLQLLLDELRNHQINADCIHEYSIDQIETAMSPKSSPMASAAGYLHGKVEEIIKQLSSFDLDWTGAAQTSPAVQKPIPNTPAAVMTNGYANHIASSNELSLTSSVQMPHQVSLNPMHKHTLAAA